jgi:hypothetical protein
VANPTTPLHALLKELEAKGIPRAEVLRALPKGLSIDGLSNQINLGRQEKKRLQRAGMSGRQWVRLRKLLRVQAKDMHIRDTRFHDSTESNKAAW